MKRLFTLLIITIYVSGCAPKITPPYDGPVQYISHQKVLPAGNYSKEEIVTLLKRWAVEHYKSYRAVYEYSDTSYFAVNGAMTTSQELRYAGGMRETLVSDFKYQLRALTKDGKTQITVDSFTETLPLTKLDIPVHDRATDINKNRRLRMTEGDRKEALYKINYRHDLIDREVSRLFDSIQKSINNSNNNW